MRLEYWFLAGIGGLVLLGELAWSASLGGQVDWCSVGEGGSCSDIGRLRFAWIPFLPEEAGQHAAASDVAWRIPTPLLGIAWAGVLFVAGLQSRRRWVSLVLGFVGVCVSLLFIAAMVWLGNWCPTCIGFNVLNILTCGLLGLGANLPKWLSERAGVLTAIVGVAVCLQFGVDAKTRYARLEVRHNRFAADYAGDFSRILGGLTSGQQVQEVLEAGDVVLGRSHSSLTITVYGDSQCPHCSAFLDYSRDRLESILGEDFALVFRHFPLSSQCNPMVTRDYHERACSDAVSLARAFRERGRKGFWSVYDELVHQSKDGSGGMDAAAQRLQDRSEQLWQQVLADVQSIRNVKGVGIPRVFVNGWLIPTPYLRVDGFWRTLGEFFRGAPRGNSGAAVRKR